MKIILLQDVPEVGKKWETKEVKGGYARNYLLTRGLATLATPGALKDIELKQKQEVQKKAIQEDLLLKSFDSLRDSVFTIARKANEKGRLFDGLDIKEVGEILKEKLKIEIPLEFVKLEKPIKAIGKYKISVQKGDREIFFEIEITPV